MLRGRSLVPLVIAAIVASMFLGGFAFLLILGDEGRRGIDEFDEIAPQATDLGAAGRRAGNRSIFRPIRS